MEIASASAVGAAKKISFTPIPPRSTATRIATLFMAAPHLDLSYTSD
jgi:hypothetical protein